MTTSIDLLSPPLQATPRAETEPHGPAKGLLLMAIVILLYVVGTAAVSEPAADQTGAALAKAWDSDALALNAFLQSGTALLIGGFAAALSSALRAAGDNGTGPRLALVGGALAAAGLAIDANLALFLVDQSSTASAETIKTFAELRDGLFMPMVGGLGLMLVAAGVSTLRTQALPRGLAIATIVLGVIAPIGPAGFATFMLGAPLLAAAGVVLYRRAA